MIHSSKGSHSLSTNDRGPRDNRKKGVTSSEHSTFHLNPAESPRESIATSRVPRPSDTRRAIQQAMPDQPS